MKPFCFSLSGIYESEGYAWEQAGKIWDLRELRGTDGYLDPETEQFLEAELGRKKETKELPRIRLLDSGNYHYMTKLWLTKIEKPFALLTYDNHTDMQPPAFGGILSCGGWIAASLEELKNLEHVILIGPDEAAYEQVEEELKEKVIFLSREKLQEMNDAEISRFLTEVLCETLPLYISIDKDVLCPDDAQTTWSQGDMKLTTLLSGVKTVLECAKKTGVEIVGVDICGEADVEAAHENEANDLANEKLLEILDTYF